MVPDTSARKAILGFMSTRCDVISQHKLPTIEEIKVTTTAGIIGVDRTIEVIDALVQDGTLIAYGPYISDREIDVL